MDGGEEIEPWTHFGTLDAAKERVGGSGVVDSLISSVEVSEADDGTWGYELLGADSWETYDTPEEARAAGEAEAARAADYQDPPEAMLTEAWLRGRFVRIPDLGLWSLRDVISNLPGEVALDADEKERIWDLSRSGYVGQDWDELTRVLLSRGIAGFVYKNRVEDRGSDSYLVIDPSAVTVTNREEWR